MAWCHVVASCCGCATCKQLWQPVASDADTCLVVADPSIHFLDCVAAHSLQLNHDPFINLAVDSMEEVDDWRQCSYQSVSNLVMPAAHTRYILVTISVFVA